MGEPIDFRALKQTFVVAEIGVNHEGDARLAEEMVRLAAASGADAVKFQTYVGQGFVSSALPERRERSARFSLHRTDFQSLARMATENGIAFFSTPLDFESADFLDEIAPLFKIASGDLTFTALIRHVAAKRKPLIISTGLGTAEEVQAAVNAAREGNPEIIDCGHLLLMHCVSAYPTPAEEAHVANVRWLKREFGLPVGYSDHTIGIKACELAVAAGASAIEKHFTYRKENQEFHDHALSADPNDMRELIACLREAESYLGAEERSRGPSEVKVLSAIRRSAAARADIPAGAPIRSEWLTCLRPAEGIDAARMDHLVGRSLVRNITAGEIIREEDLAD